MQASVAPPPAEEDYGGAFHRWQESAPRNSAWICPALPGTGVDGSIAVTDVERQWRTA